MPQANNATLQNVGVAAAILTDLLMLAQQVSSMIQTAQAAKVDITPQQLSQLQANYASAHARLDADIASLSATSASSATTTSS